MLAPPPYIWTLSWDWIIKWYCQMTSTNRARLSKESRLFRLEASLIRLLTKQSAWRRSVGVSNLLIKILQAWDYWPRTSHLVHMVAEESYVEMSCWESYLGQLFLGLNCHGLMSECHEEAWCPMTVWRELRYGATSHTQRSDTDWPRVGRSLLISSPQSLTF